MRRTVGIGNAGGLDDCALETMARAGDACCLAKMVCLCHCNLSIFARISSTCAVGMPLSRWLTSAAVQALVLAVVVTGTFTLGDVEPDLPSCGRVLPLLILKNTG